MPEQQPLGPVSYALGALTPTDFERVNWRLVRLAHPRVLFLDNPDGGVDAVLPSDDNRSYVRAWQAKRYTSSIKWGECEKSLDDAVKNYKVPHVTFCFPRNLTGPQEKAFRKRLANRKSGVKVDWIGADELHTLLTESTEGQKVAKFFFGAPFDETEKYERAVALGGKVDTTAQKLGHLRRVQKTFDDPYIDVFSAAYRTGRPSPVPDGTFFSMIDLGPDETSRLDFAARDEQAAGVYDMGFKMTFTDDDAGHAAREAVRRALSSGGGARIEGGVNITFTGFPEYIQQTLGEGGTPDIIELSPNDPLPVAPPPWQAALSVPSDPPGTEPVLVDLAPRPTSGGWDTLFEGTTGGLTITVQSRWLDDHGELKVNLRHLNDRSPAAEQAASLRLLMSLAAGSQLTITDRSGGRPVMNLTSPGAGTFAPESEALLGFYEDVALIERECKVALPLPESLSPEEHQRTRFIGRAVRERQLPVNFAEVTLDVDEAGLAQMQEGGQVVAAYPEMRGNVFGIPVPLPCFGSLEPYVVSKVEATAEEPQAVRRHPDAARGVRRRIPSQARPGRNSVAKTEHRSVALVRTPAIHSSVQSDCGTTLLAASCHRNIARCVTGAERSLLPQPRSFPLGRSTEQRLQRRPQLSAAAKLAR